VFAARKTETGWYNDGVLAPDTLLPLTLFASSAAFTPGPNNMIAAVSGANFGFRRSLPFLLGVAIGFPLLFVAIALGLSGLFRHYPQAHTVLKFVGVGVIFYLAWRIGTGGALGKVDTGSRPLSFLQSCAFQWVNGKAWVFTVSMISAFTSPERDLLGQALAMAALFALLSFASVASWCLFGTWLRRWLKSERRLRFFNIGMALALAGSVLLVLV
jgi:threonine/homoserine/homoserine lactone efflux protein